MSKQASEVYQFSPETSEAARNAGISIEHAQTVFPWSEPWNSPAEDNPMKVSMGNKAPAFYTEFTIEDVTGKVDGLPNSTGGICLIRGVVQAELRVGDKTYATGGVTYDKPPYNRKKPAVSKIYRHDGPGDGSVSITKSGATNATVEKLTGKRADKAAEIILKRAERKIGREALLRAREVQHGFFATD